MTQTMYAHVNKWIKKNKDFQKPISKQLWNTRLKKIVHSFDHIPKERANNYSLSILLWWHIGSFYDSITFMLIQLEKLEILLKIITVLMWIIVITPTLSNLDFDSLKIWSWIQTISWYWHYFSSASDKSLKTRDPQSKRLK
jgi:hypothetical protein